MHVRTNLPRFQKAKNYKNTEEKKNKSIRPCLKRERKTLQLVLNVTEISEY